MSWHRVWTVMRREWLELRLNKGMSRSLLLMPLLFVGMALGMMAWLSVVGEGDDFNQFAGLPPQVAAMGGKVVAMVVVTEQFLIYLLMLPLLLPQMMTTTSIVGEKEAKSLEPLLATPVETGELMLAKTLAAVIPATFLCWSSFVVLVFGGWLISPYAAAIAFLRPAWVFGFAVQSPLLGVISALIGVMVSARAKDTKSAQSVGGLVVLPVMFIGIGMLLAQKAVTVGMQLGVSAVALVLLYPLLKLAVRLFEREQILTRWK